VTKKLELQAENGSWSNVGMNVSNNALGEFLYTVPGPLLPNPTAFMSNNALSSVKGPIAPEQSAAAKSSAPSVSLSPQTFVSAQPSPSSFSSPVKSGSGKNAATPIPMTITYPVEPAEPSYGSLPPTPAAPVNYLAADRSYKFTISATLFEYKNGTWAPALKKNNSPVSQTVAKQFRTGPAPAAMSNMETY